MDNDRIDETDLDRVDHDDEHPGDARRAEDPNSEDRDDHPVGTTTGTGAGATTGALVGGAVAGPAGAPRATRSAGTRSPTPAPTTTTDDAGDRRT
jgi:hypothetical protein